MPAITGKVCPSFNPSRSQSSNVERNSSSHSLKLAPKATTPLQEAIRPEKVPSSNLSYSACAIARSKYSLKIYCASIAASQFHTIIRPNVQDKLVCTGRGIKPLFTYLKGSIKENLTNH